MISRSGDQPRGLATAGGNIKAVPRHKIDVTDCEWPAQLLEHGLLRASFIPPAPIRDLRDLTGCRKILAQQRASEVNPVQKLFEVASVSPELSYSTHPRRFPTPEVR